MSITFLPKLENLEGSVEGGRVVGGGKLQHRSLSLRVHAHVHSPNLLTPTRRAPQRVPH
jgi:hypothetical protein